MSNLLIATASSAVPLIIWRGLAGLGGGTSLVSERLYIRRVVDRSRLAFANGLLSSAGSAGQIAGPIFGGFIAAISDLRVPFLVVGVTSSVATVAALFLPRIRETASSVAGAAATVSKLDLRALGVLLLANLALNAGYGSFITTYAPFAHDTLGWSTAEIGILFSLFGLGSITVGPALGAAADRWGRRRVGSLAVIPVFAFSLALVLSFPPLVIYPIAIAAGGGLAGFSASWFALLGTATGGPRGGRAFGTVSALSNLGIVVGALLAARLWETVEIRAGMTVMLVAIAVAGAASPPTRNREWARVWNPGRRIGSLIDPPTSGRGCPPGRADREIEEVSMNAFLIELRNKPGELARVAEAIASKGINVTAVSGSACGDGGSVAVMTADESATRMILKDAGAAFREVEVIEAPLPHQPGCWRGRRAGWPMLASTSRRCWSPGWRATTRSSRS